MLVTFAQLLMKACRGSDVVARLGGDEFLVLLTDHTEAAAENAMARLQRALDDTNVTAARRYDISFSYGLVELDPKRHHTIGALISEGESLMYRTKQARR